MRLFGSTRPQQVGSDLAACGWFVVTGPDFELLFLRGRLVAGVARSLVRETTLPPLLLCLIRVIRGSVPSGTRTKVQICRGAVNQYYSTNVYISQVLIRTVESVFIPNK
jgi:hypothetical protein